MKVLVLDNYDSFTYNLVHLIEKKINQSVDVFRNNEISLSAVEAYDRIVLSPGPGLPQHAGIMPQLIRQFGSSKKILGVCLGHQAIAQAFGAQLVNLPKVLHGVSSPIEILSDDPLFKGMPSTITVGHYHSWVVESTLPEELIVTAIDAQGRVMALRHRYWDICGVQFHPESILTPLGPQILDNWLTR